MSREWPCTMMPDQSNKPLELHNLICFIASFTVYRLFSSQQKACIWINQSCRYEEVTVKHLLRINFSNLCSPNNNINLPQRSETGEFPILQTIFLFQAESACWFYVGLCSLHFPYWPKFWAFMIAPTDHWYTVSQYNLPRILMNFIFPDRCLVIFKPILGTITTLTVDSY
jgi:hypothetical protein